MTSRIVARIVDILTILGGLGRLVWGFVGDEKDLVLLLWFMTKSRCAKGVYIVFQPGEIHIVWKIPPFFCVLL